MVTVMDTVEVPEDLAVTLETRVELLLTTGLLLGYVLLRHCFVYIELRLCFFFFKLLIFIYVPGSFFPPLFYYAIFVALCIHALLQLLVVKLSLLFFHCQPGFSRVCLTVLFVLIRCLVWEQMSILFHVCSNFQMMHIIYLLTKPRSVCTNYEV